MKLSERQKKYRNGCNAANRGQNRVRLHGPTRVLEAGLPGMISDDGRLSTSTRPHPPPHPPYPSARQDTDQGEHTSLNMVITVHMYRHGDL